MKKQKTKNKTLRTKERTHHRIFWIVGLALIVSLIIFSLLGKGELTKLSGYAVVSVETSGTAGKNPEVFGRELNLFGTAFGSGNLTKDSIMIGGVLITLIGVGAYVYDLGRRKK